MANNQMIAIRLYGVPHKKGYLASVFKNNRFIGELESYNYGDGTLCWYFNALGNKNKYLLPTIKTLKTALCYIEEKHGQ